MSKELQQRLGMPEREVDEVSVFYFVVYPDNRKHLVDRDSLERHAVEWVRDFSVKFETVVVTQRAPIYGEKRDRL